MPLDQEDKEWFMQSVELTVIKAVQPIKEATDKHEQALFGATGDNGLNSQVKDHEQEIRGINKKIYSFTGAITAVGMLLHIVYDNFLKGGK